MNKNINEKNKQMQIIKNVVKNDNGPATKTRAKIIDKANGDTKVMGHTHTGAGEGSAFSHTITADDKKAMVDKQVSDVKADLDNKLKPELKTEPLESPKPISEPKAPVSKPAASTKPSTDTAASTTPATDTTTPAEPTTDTPSADTPPTDGMDKTNPDGIIGWAALHWKEIAIGGAATAAIIIAAMKLLGKTIKVKYQKCFKTLKRMQKDFTFNKKGMDMKYILPGVGSKIMDKISRLWGKRKDNTAGAIGLVPFCQNYKNEIKADFKLAQQSFNKIIAGNAEKSASSKKVESNIVTYKSFAEAFKNEPLYESENINESLTTIMALGSLVVSAGMFAIRKFKNGKPVEGSEVAVQVTQQSTREVCYAIINNFCSKYINMQAVVDKMGIKNTDIGDLDKSTFEKFSGILKQYASAKPANYTAQYARIKTMYDKMLKHYFDIGAGVINNFAKYAAPEKSNEKDDNLILASKEKLMAMWEQQHDTYENNFSHVVVEIISSPEYVNYVNFIIEDVLPVFETGVAGDADYILNVMPKAGEQYLLRQTLKSANVKNGAKNLGNIVLATVVSFDEKTKNIVIKRNALVRDTAIEFNNDGTCTVKNPRNMDFTKFDDKEGITVPYQKWIAMDPTLTREIAPDQQVVITNPDAFDEKTLTVVKEEITKGDDEKTNNFIIQNIMNNIVINIIKVENDYVVANVVAIAGPAAVQTKDDGTSVVDDQSDDLVKIESSNTIKLPYAAIWESLPMHVDNPIDNTPEEQEQTTIEEGEYVINNMFEDGNGERQYLVKVSKVEDDKVTFTEIATVTDDNIKSEGNVNTVVGLTDENKKDIKAEEQTISVQEFKESDPLKVSVEENKPEETPSETSKFTKIYEKTYESGENTYPVVVCATKAKDEDESFNVVLIKTVDGNNTSYNAYDVTKSFTQEEFDKMFVDSSYTVMDKPVEEVFNKDFMKGTATIENLEAFKGKISEYIKSKGVDVDKKETETPDVSESLNSFIKNTADRFVKFSNAPFVNSNSAKTAQGRYKSDPSFDGYLTYHQTSLDSLKGRGEHIEYRIYEDYPFTFKESKENSYVGFSFIPILCYKNSEGKNEALKDLTAFLDKTPQQGTSTNANPQQETSAQQNAANGNPPQQGTSTNANGATESLVTEAVNVEVFPVFYLISEKCIKTEKGEYETDIPFDKAPHIALTKENVTVENITKYMTECIEPLKNSFVTAKQESVTVDYSKPTINENCASATRTISGIKPSKTSRYYILSESFWGTGNVNESKRILASKLSRIDSKSTIDSYSGYAKNNEHATFESFKAESTISATSYSNIALTSANPLYESVVIIETDNTLDRNIKRVINTGIHKIVK